MRLVECTTTFVVRLRGSLKSVDWCVTKCYLVRAPNQYQIDSPRRRAIDRVTFARTRRRKGRHDRRTRPRGVVNVRSRRVAARRAAVCLLGGNAAAERHGFVNAVIYRDFGTHDLMKHKSRKKRFFFFKFYLCVFSFRLTAKYNVVFFRLRATAPSRPARKKKKHSHRNSVNTHAGVMCV